MGRLPAAPCHASPWSYAWARSSQSSSPTPSGHSGRTGRTGMGPEGRLRARPARHRAIFVRSSPGRVPRIISAGRRAADGLGARGRSPAQRRRRGARKSCSIRRWRLDGRIDLETFIAPLSVSEPATNDAHRQLHPHLPNRRCQHQEWASPPRMRWTVRLGRLKFYQRPCQ